MIQPDFFANNLLNIYKQVLTEFTTLSVKLLIVVFLRYSGTVQHLPKREL
jgi:hypothetical protein